MILHASRSVALALLPSFLSSSPSAENRPLGPTAYLNGLRGVAALIVLIHHFSKDPFPWLLWGWGSSPDSAPQYRFFQLPIVRILHAGPSMVAVFFVISGFSLSYKPLKLLRGHENTFYETLVSSVFRRGMRLYIPCIITTFFMAVAVYLGWAPFPSDRPREASFLAELIAWGWSLHALINPLNLKFVLPRYDDNLWTISTEFRNSMVLFLSLLGLSRTRLQSRIVLEIVLACWFFSYAYWDTFLFIAGLIIAEIHVLHENHSISIAILRPSTKFHSPRKAAIIHAIWLTIFLFGIFLASVPLLSAEKSVGFSWLTLHMPLVWHAKAPERYLASLSAPLLVLSVEHSPFLLQKIFTSRPAQYLGQISFSLYILHGPVRYTLYHPILDVAIEWAGSGKDGGGSKEIGFMWGVMGTWFIVIPVTVCAADVFWRVVDVRSVKFSRWVEERYSGG